MGRPDLGLDGIELADRILTALAGCRRGYTARRLVGVLRYWGDIPADFPYREALACIRSALIMLLVEGKVEATDPRYGPPLFYLWWEGE